MEGNQAGKLRPRSFQERVWSFQMACPLSLDFAFCWGGPGRHLLCSHSKQNCPAGSAAGHTKPSFHMTLIWTSCQQGGQSPPPKGPGFTRKGSRQRETESNPAAGGGGEAALVLSQQGRCSDGERDSPGSQAGLHQWHSRSDPDAHTHRLPGPSQEAGA